MKKRIFIIVIALALLMPPSFMVYRRIQNYYVAQEIKAELEKWYKTVRFVPDGENGALPIKEGMKKFQFSRDYREMLHTDFDPGCSSYIKKTRKYIEEKSAALEKVYEGLGYEKYQYTRPDIDFFSEDILSFIEIRTVAAALILKGRLLELDGKDDAALEEYLNALRLSVTMKDEMYIIKKMIEVAVTCMALEVIYEKFENASLTKKQLQKTLGKLTDLYHKPPKGVFTFEYYTAIKSIKYFCEGTFDLDNISGFVKKYREMQNVRFNRWHADFRSDYELVRKWRNHYSDIDFVDFFGRPEDKQRGYFAKMLMENHRWDYQHAMHWDSWLSSSTAWCSVLEKDMYWRGAAMTCAILLYKAENGKLPDSLDAIADLLPKKMLIDPFSGKNFIYKTKGNAFQLYSVGEDGVDDNCTAPPEWVMRARIPVGPDLVYHKGF
jgi:hypothetical protein